MRDFSKTWCNYWWEWLGREGDPRVISTGMIHVLYNHICGASSVAGGKEGDESPEVWGQMTGVWPVRQAPGSYLAGCRILNQAAVLGTRVEHLPEEWCARVGWTWALERWWAGPGALLTWKPPKSSGIKLYGHNFIHIKHTCQSVHIFHHKRKQFNWKLKFYFHVWLYPPWYFKIFTYFNIVN